MTPVKPDTQEKAGFRAARHTNGLWMGQTSYSTVNLICWAWKPRYRYIAIEMMIVDCQPSSLRSFYHSKCRKSLNWECFVVVEATFEELGPHLYIPPWTVVAGLGTLSRQEICSLLPHFEDTSLPNLVVDKLQDIIGWLDKNTDAKNEAAFSQRLRDASQRIMASDASDGALRVRLWDHLLASFAIDATLPLSSRVANTAAAELTHNAALTLADQFRNDKAPNERSFLGEARQRLTALFSRGNVDFSTIVVAQAELVAGAVADAVQQGSIPEDDKTELIKRVRAQIEQVPPELRNEAMERALKSGDTALIGLLASGSSLVGVGIAVKLAGFSAYIFAAQAAAIIPFIGGSMATSMLFVLANPLFIGPAILVGAHYAGRQVKGTHAKQLAANITVQLSLQGIAAGRSGLQTAIDDFRGLSAFDFEGLPEKRRSRLVRKLFDVQQRLGSPLPPAPGEPAGVLARPIHTDTDSALHRILFSAKGGNVDEALVVGGLTVGDILYDAVAIDPTVLRAADFSRSEDISDICSFGAFADRIALMTGESLTGAESNLRGYVAEQIVAARLVEQGHIVTFPDMANNPGFDLLVDGHAFQIKCLESISGLREHFEKYPDMPVFANGELADTVIDSTETWTDKVFYVEGFDREITDFVTKAALDAGASLGEMDVPYFAVAVSTAKNLFGWWRGQIPLADLPLSVVLDGAIKGGLSAAGGFSGNVLGLLLFGPAGALVFGGVGGAGAILGSHWTREQATRLISGEWLDELEDATSAFRQALIRALQIKIDLLLEKRSQIASQVHECQSWLFARASDDLCALAEHIYELNHEVPVLAPPDCARRCLQTMTASSVHPWAVQGELSNLLSTLKRQPSLTESTSKKAVEVWGALRERVSQNT